MLYFLVENLKFESFGAPHECQNELKHWKLYGLNDVVKSIVEIHLGLDTSAFAFALNYKRVSNILMHVGKKFDSHNDFKSKFGDDDEVVGKIQNDELSTVQKCFIPQNKRRDDWGGVLT